MIQYEIRPGAYYDSVVLMQLQRDLLQLPGVADAGVVMGTPANLEILTASGLLAANLSVKADDLLIVVKGKSETAVTEALAQIDILLAHKQTAVSNEFRPRSLEAAMRAVPHCNWVLVSVPGRYAAGVARDAINAGKHVFLYSDNVPLEDEVILKQLARKRGVLLMGPDCGTAVINGIGFGFANRVRRGSIGLVGASGTGLQAITSEIHNLGAGVSQVIGTGGRDLKKEVGAITTQQALHLLGEDEETRVIVLVSKPPAPQVVTQLLRQAQSLGKPVVVNFIGYPMPGHVLGNLHFAPSLSDTAELAVKLNNAVTTDVDLRQTPFQGYLRGLFSGGTLAYEVLLGLQGILYPLHSNIPIRPEQKLAHSHTSQAHTILDLGEDEFTQGRLHPMMDNDLRLRRLRQEIADPEVGFILLDVVLGEGAHPDPATELAPAIAEAVKRKIKVVAIVIGTDNDPQDVNAQIERLIAAGATVFATANEAVDYVFNRVAAEPWQYPAVPLAGLKQGITAVNVGLESFYQSVMAQGATAVQLDWRPPAGGNEALMAILAKMKQG